MTTGGKIVSTEAEIARIRESLRPTADRELAQRSIPSTVILLLLSLVFICLETTSPLATLGFRGLIIGVLALSFSRLVWALLYDRLARSRRRLWRRVFGVSAGLTSACIGLAAAGYIVFEGLSVSGALLIIGATGIAAGASVSLAPSRALQKVYLSGLLVPICLLPLARGGSPILALSGMAVLYLVYIWVQSGFTHDGYWEVLIDRQLLEDKALELEHARSAAMTALNARGEFLANVSHEIRTPMNGVLGMTALALGTELNREQREYLEIAQSSGESLLALLNDILDLSKMEAGKLILERRPLCPRTLVEETLRVFQVRYQTRELAIRSEIDDRLPEVVLGDAGRLRQALVNLLSNAVKFTESGEIVLSARFLGVDAGCQRLFFSVRDTGPGIPKQKREKIFDAFTQEDASVSRKHGGTGLGLAITSQLVRLMGGEIQLESEPGAGSTFLFTAVFDEADEFTTTATSDTSRDSISGAQKLAERGPIRVLVAEDNQVNRLLIERALAKRGMTVISALDGDEAVATWRRESVDVVLMDVQMPGTDGLEATRRIRKLEADDAARVPIIALTAQAMSGDRERCLEAGMDDYLSKPVNIKELIRMVEIYALQHAESLG